MNGNNPIHTELTNCKMLMGSGDEEIRSCPCTAEDCPTGTTFISNSNLTIPINKIHCVGQTDSNFGNSPFCVCQNQKLLSHHGECVDPMECTCREKGIIINPGRIQETADPCGKQCECIEGRVENNLSKTAIFWGILKLDIFGQQLEI